MFRLGWPIGTTVVADEEYMTTAIVDPNAQIRAGYRGIMPERQLDPDDVEAIVTYLRELGPGGSTPPR